MCQFQQSHYQGKPSESYLQKVDHMTKKPIQNSYSFCYVLVFKSVGFYVVLALVNAGGRARTNRHEDSRRHQGSPTMKAFGKKLCSFLVYSSACAYLSTSTYVCWGVRRVVAAISWTQTVIRNWDFCLKTGAMTGIKDY